MGWGGGERRLSREYDVGPGHTWKWGGGVGDEGVVIDNRLHWSQVQSTKFHSGW